MAAPRAFIKPIVNLVRQRPVLAVIEVTLRCNSACGYHDLPLNEGRYEMIGEDFENDAAKDTFARRSSKQAGVLAFVLEYLEDERAINILRKNRFKIRYFDYDWNLNEQA